MPFHSFEKEKEIIETAFPEFSWHMGELKKYPPSVQRKWVEQTKRRIEKLRRMLAEFPLEDQAETERIGCQTEIDHIGEPTVTELIEYQREAERTVEALWEQEVRTYDFFVEQEHRIREGQNKGLYSEYHLSEKFENRLISYFIVQLIKGGLSQKRACEALAVVLPFECYELVKDLNEPTKFDPIEDEGVLYTIYNRFRRLDYDETKGVHGFGWGVPILYMGRGFRGSIRPADPDKPGFEAGPDGRVTFPKPPRDEDPPAE